MAHIGNQFTRTAVIDRGGDVYARIPGQCLQNNVEACVLSVCLYSELQTVRIGRSLMSQTVILEEGIAVPVYAFGLFLQEQFLFQGIHLYDVFPA